MSKGLTLAQKLGRAARNLMHEPLDECALAFVDEVCVGWYPLQGGMMGRVELSIGERYSLLAWCPVHQRERTMLWLGLYEVRREEAVEKMMAEQAPPPYTFRCRSVIGPWEER